MSTMLVAATGGHLKQLHLLSRGIDTRQRHWVTFDKEQSRSLLAGEAVDFVPFIGSRDPANALRGLRTAGRLLRRHRPTEVMSTGSAIALPYLLLGRVAGARCIYIESAARSEGPSMTGRMIARIPGVQLRTQYEAWASARWLYTGSVFDVFEPQARTATAPVRRILVTLGTLRYDFSRLVRQVAGIVDEGTEITWQSGGTIVDERLGTVRTFLPEADLVDAMRAADVVIAHAGVGSALSALEAGKAPILVPRRLVHGEHIDDHQEQVANHLAARGLAFCREVEDLSNVDLARAASLSVHQREA